MKITTNYRPRDLVAVCDIDMVDQAQFDYVNEGDERYYPRLFNYRGEWYDTDEFVRIVPFSTSDNSFCHRSDDDEMLKWSGIQTQSAFDAVVIRYTDDHEGVVAGRATW